MTQEEHRVGDVWRHPSGHEMRVADVQRSSFSGEVMLIAADGEGGGRPEFFAHNGYRRVPRAEVDLADLRAAARAVLLAVGNDDCDARDAAWTRLRALLETGS